MEQPEAEDAFKSYIKMIPGDIAMIARAFEGAMIIQSDKYIIDKYKLDIMYLPV